MNRFLSILLLLIYLSTALNLFIQIHYCNNRIESVQLLSGEIDECCKPEQNTGCCHNEVKIIKLDSDQNSNYNRHSLYVSFPAELHEYSALRIFCIQSITKTQDLSYNPPDTPPLPIWLKYCSLTYYG